jgi:hypothetical protein
VLRVKRAAVQPELGDAAGDDRRHVGVASGGEVVRHGRGQDHLPHGRGDAVRLDEDAREVIA